jgi:hypothetical protein
MTHAQNVSKLACEKGRGHTFKAHTISYLLVLLYLLHVSTGGARFEINIFKMAYRNFVTIYEYKIIEKVL